jgi:NADP-dependent 3-hydroxy acid dehydrogenase YdfG
MHIPEARDLSGTVIAVTGASSGIGRACARAVVGEGGRLALLARRKERLVELADELGEDNVVVVAGDIREPADNRALVDAAIERFGRLDSLVANAGIGRYGGILDGTDDELEEMMTTNFAGTVWSARAAIPTMISQGGGDVVVVSSVAGLRGGANEAVYAATKFAQVGLAGAMDRELREKGIRVSLVCPAAVNTEFALGAGRVAGDPWLGSVMQAQDVAAAVVAVLQQPRRLRTQLWTLWSMAEAS